MYVEAIGAQTDVDPTGIPEARQRFYEAIVRRVDKHGHSRAAVGQQILIDHAADLELPKIDRRTNCEGTGAGGMQLKLAAVRPVR